MKKMLINATQKEEVRIALVEDKQLIDLDVEQRKNDNKKSNIYNGVISRVEPSLEACFVNYGEQRDGFLPIKDIHPSYYENLPGNSAKDKLKPGQKLIVQVAREERGNKGAALTTYVAIASTFLVLMPKSPDVEGISRRLSGEERDNLRQKLNSIGIKPTEGVIVRTAGTGCTTEELQYDLNILHFIWDMIQKYSEENPEVGILHHESETIVRVIRDYLTKDVDEIITDSKDAYNKVAHYLKLVRPKSKPHLTLKDVDNIFACPEYDIESQIAQAYDREVKLKSGGSIVIDTTEALTAIDVNSSRSTGNQDIESTAISTNLEAADEIARQLKIRDIGGLIVIDFIDMNSSANQRKVEERMKKACGDDRARTQLARISKFGLLEVSRQRIRGSIAESINHKCPRCSGTGFIRDNESISLQILRQANEEATRVGKIVKLHIMVPYDIAAYLLNEKREKITLLEQQHNIQIVVVPQAGLESPHYYIYRVRKGDSVKDNLSFSLPEYYRELEKAPRKSRAVDRNDEKLTQSSSSVPLEHIDKTFEARLEKAEFIQQAVAQEESEKSLFNRAKRWFVGLFTNLKKSPKAEEVVEEKVVSSRRKRRRSRKERNRNMVIADATLDSASNLNSEETIETKFNKKTEKPVNSKRSRTEKYSLEVAEKSNESTPVAVRKQIKSGDVVEEVLGGNSKRKRRKKDKLAFADINPQEVKSIVEQQEATMESIVDSKPKLTRAERRRLQRVKDLDPEYDYEFSEENLGLDSEVVTKPRRRKDKITKAQIEAEKGIELSKEDIVESKLDLLEADELSTDIQVPRKASRSERRRLAQERQAQNVAKEDNLVNTQVEEDKSDSTNDVNTKIDDKTTFNENTVETADKPTVDTNQDNVELNLDNSNVLSSATDRKKPRRRRKVNIEKKDLFLSRVPPCVDQDTLNSWLNPQICDDLLDDVDVTEYQQVPSLMDIVASDGSVDIKERSPYRQVVRPSLPARKSNIYLGTVNSEDFEATMTQALANSNTNTIDTELDVNAIVTKGTINVADNLSNNQMLSDNFVNELVDTVSLDKYNTDKPVENLSRRERARRAKAAKQERVGTNTTNSYRYFVFKAKQPCVNFNVEYDKVNRSKKRYNALLNKKVKPKIKEEVKTSLNLETANVDMMVSSAINTLRVPQVEDSSVRMTSKSEDKTINSKNPTNLENNNQPTKEILFTQFDDYAKNVGFTEELQTTSLNNLNSNVNPRNHLNSITEELKDLTSKKQKEVETKLNDHKEEVLLSPLDAHIKVTDSEDSLSSSKTDLDSTIVAVEIEDKVQTETKLGANITNVTKSSTNLALETVTESEVTTNNEVNSPVNESLELITPLATEASLPTNAKVEFNSIVKEALEPTSTSNVGKSLETTNMDSIGRKATQSVVSTNLDAVTPNTLDKASTKVSSFINLPDDSALVVFSNKTTNTSSTINRTSALELPLLDDLSNNDSCTVGTRETCENVTPAPDQPAVVLSGGVLSKARSFSVGSTTTKVEHSDIEIPTTFDQYESNYTYRESGKSVSSPSKHTSTK